MALHRRTETGRDMRTVLADVHLHRGEIERMRLDACIATDEHPARRVVGDSVLNLDLPVVDARVDDLETRQHVIGGVERSEEHTSELQSLMRISYAVFCLKK